MSVGEETASEPRHGEPAPRPRRPLRKRVMHCVRRGHLYLGLFLLPWAILYGVTGFLFNHPSAFADVPAREFGRSELAGTPLEYPPVPAEVAGRVVAALNDRAPDGTRYQLASPEKAKYTREFAFATVKADGQEVSVLLDVAGKGGTVRSRVVAPPKVEERAPFAVGTGPKAAPKGDRPARPAGPGLALADPLHDRVKAAVPVVLERTGFPGGEVTVTSVPDLSFHMTDGTKTWVVTYNAMTGGVSGRSADEPAQAEDLSTRRFLTRLHTAHGYPGEQNARWFWAVVVDAMAFVMVFWGVSGLFMWWQIKATRKFGFLILLLSLAAATTLGLGMHEVMTTR
ncbi:MAG TPA: PepSY domain-containing protein [Gemmata sp.]|nr:PepSY domain-containing protein [Gemmata sp.]